MAVQMGQVVSFCYTMVIE